MKSVIILMTLCIFSIQSFAQLENKTLLFGGGLSFNITNYKYSGDTSNDADETAFSFYPEAGIFIFDNIAIGLISKIGVSNVSDNDAYNTNNKTNTFEYSLGPYFRYYTPIEPFAFYVELNYQFGKMNRTTKVAFEDVQRVSEEYESKIDLSKFTPGIGLEYFFNKSVGINAAVKYEISNREIKSYILNQLSYSYKQKINGVVFLIGFQVHLNFNNW